jgi:hypothetical protein
MFVPAESVYAVFEVKQEIDKTLRDSSRTKIASVRRLKRASVPIRHAGGTFAAQDPKHILGGILTTRNGWADLQGKAAVTYLTPLPVAAASTSPAPWTAAPFHLPEQEGGDPEYNTEGTVLIFFVVRLFRRLQGMGTVVAADIDKYATPITEG